MASMQARGFSDAQRSELWWASGQSLTVIGEALGKQASTIYGVVARLGGIAPAARRRAARALCLAEREEISRGLAAKLSIRQIAAKLGRTPP